MLVSTKGRYALRIMLELAQGEKGAYVPLPLIAKKQDISEKYLESIVSALVRGGLVEGMRGKGGGYRLNRELKDYSVGEILRLTEGSLPARRPVQHAPHVGEAGGSDQRLSGQRLAGGSFAGKCAELRGLIQSFPGDF